LVLRDASGAELNRLRYSVAGHGNLSRSLEKNAELQVRLDKADYAPGERAELQIKGPYAGAGLIAVERDKVYAHEWFRAGVAASTHSIRIPEGLEGNGYITVTLLRAPDSKEIFMSPLSHGVAPFTVSRARRSLDVSLEAPETLKPGATCVLRVSSPRRARVVVFAADEGILQAASWRTPDPLGYFLRKRALEVKTFQILDLLLPEHRLSMALMAPGGDRDGWDAAGRNLNPFKRRRDAPAVFWSGLLDVGPEGRTVSFVVPDSFNGTLRATVVAADASAVGVATRKILVRSALVLTPSAPLFAAPGDEFEASVSVANGVKGSGPGAKIAVALKTSGHLEAVGGSVREVAASEGREGVATFRLKAKPALGSASLVFEASLSSETARREISLSVRPPVPYQVSLTGGRTSGRAAAATPRALYPSFRVLEASVSPLPLVLARGLIRYLEKYPYGCTEQLVSQAFPALILRHRPEFGYAPEIVAANLARAVDVLRSRQNEEGAFGFWAANSNVSEFQAVYAAHFLTEAKEKGDAVPPELLDRALGHLAQVAAGAPGADAPPRVRAYAIYVLTRNGRVTTALINGLRESLEKSGDGSWRKDLTAAYLASSCALLRLDGQADALIRGVPVEGPPAWDDEWFYDEPVHQAQLVYLLARHFPRRFAETGADAVEALAASLDRGRFSTLSSAYAILALDAAAAADGEVKPEDARLTEVREGGARAPLSLPPALFSKTEFSPAARALELEDRSDHPLYYQAAQSGYDLKPSAEPERRGLEIEREILDEKNDPVTKARLGGEYRVRLRLRATGGRRVPNVAVVDLAPGGFEPVTPRAGDGEGAGRFDYRDVREDRVLFFGAAGGTMLELTYRIKAAARGRFAVPRPYAESMYDRAIYAYGAAGSVEVE
jgi:uncharacterized protein YfaS (alpha-2-macroglobulin family)